MLTRACLGLRILTLTLANRVALFALPAFCAAMANMKPQLTVASQAKDSANGKRLDLSSGQYNEWHVIQSYDDREWERFIEEWCEGFDLTPPRFLYQCS